MDLDILSELSTPRPMAADRSRWLSLLNAAVRASDGVTSRFGRQQQVGRVVVVPVAGPVGHRSAFAAKYGTEVSSLSADLAALARSEAVGAIVLDIDSPGGGVDGVPELADQIKAIRKTTVSVSRTFMASAGYWIGAACDVVLCMRSGSVGSIGVWSAHVDVSGAEEKLGVKTTLVASSPEKVEGHPFGPLGEEARATMQRSVDNYYKMFAGAVSRYRGIAVLPKHGRMFDGEDAARERLVDGLVSNMGEVLGMAGGLAGMSSNRRAQFGREVDIARYDDAIPAADVAKAALSRVTGDNSYTPPWRIEQQRRERELRRLGV